MSGWAGFGGSGDKKNSSAGQQATTAQWLNFIGNNAVEVAASEAEASVRDEFPLLLDSTEHVQLAFLQGGGMLGRDKTYFTTHRILLQNGKGIGTKRKNFSSVPYWSMQAFSVETGGAWDGDVELKVWTTGKSSTIKMDFAKSTVDIFAIQQFLNTKCNWLDAQGTQDYVNGEPLASSSETSSSGAGALIDWLGNNATQVSPASVDDTFKTQFPVLMTGEVVALAYTAGRDFVIFTNKRFLKVNVKGLIGKKIEFTSFPWRSFSGFSVETAGAYFDRDTQMRLFTNLTAFGVVEQDFRNAAADIFTIQTFLSNMILGEDTNVSDQVGDRKQGHVDPKTSWWFRDDQRPLDAVEMDTYYHNTVPLLLEAEHVEMAFKGRRDVTLFTTKRVIDIDPKGMSGSKVEYMSVPWKSVLGFAVSTAGKLLDWTCEAKIFTDMMFFMEKPERTGNDDESDPEPQPVPGMSMREFSFNKNHVNVLAVKKYLSARCLKAAPDIKLPQNVYMVAPEETGIEQFLSRIGNDQTAIDPTELNAALHTTNPILMDDENTVMAFKAGRDVTLFTTLRVLIIDAQGLSGVKVQYTSIPYASIRTFSATSAGGWDRDSEIKLSTRNLWTLGKVKLDFRKGKADIVSIQKFLAAICLGNNEEAGKYLESTEPVTAKTNALKFDSFTSWIANNSSADDAAGVDSQLHSDPPILLEEERVKRAFRSGRDMYVYTNQRVIVVDVQGLNGEKVEYKSFPWQWCQGFEFETAGMMDKDAELYIHLDVPSQNVLKQSVLVKNFDIYSMHQFLYNIVLIPKEVS